MALLKISSDKVFTGEGSLSQLDNILPAYKNILLFNDKDGFHPCGAADYFSQKFNQKFLQGGLDQSVSGSVGQYVRESLDQKVRRVEDEKTEDRRQMTEGRGRPGVGTRFIASANSINN